MWFKVPMKREIMVLVRGPVICSPRTSLGVTTPTVPECKKPPAHPFDAQVLSLGTVAFSALMMWKGLTCFTGSKSRFRRPVRQHGVLGLAAETFPSYTEFSHFLTLHDVTMSTILWDCMFMKSTMQCWAKCQNCQQAPITLSGLNVLSSRAARSRTCLCRRTVGGGWRSNQRITQRPCVCTLSPSTSVTLPFDAIIVQRFSMSVNSSSESRRPMRRKVPGRITHCPLAPPLR